MPVALAHDALGEAGEPLAVLHGLLGSRSNWRTIARALARRRRVFLLDARNHGRSPHAAGQSYPEQVEDVVAWMDAAGLERCALLGHSMGGKTAMLTALVHPSRVARLVVVDIAPLDYAADGEHRALIDAMSALTPAELESRSRADQVLAGAVPDPALRAFLLHNLARSSSGGFEWRANLAALSAELPALRAFPAPAGAKPYPGPSLFLRGARSDYVDARGERAIRARFPDAVLETVEDAGHWLHAEKPAEMSERIDAFLSSRPRPSPAG